MCKILPTYCSVWAQMVSCPQGLGTCCTGTRPLIGGSWLLAVGCRLRGGGQKPMANSGPPVAERQIYPSGPWRGACYLPAPSPMLLAPRHLPRLTATVGLFTRYGLADFARQQGLRSLVQADEEDAIEEGRTGANDLAVGFRKRLVELGPAYVKLG